MIAMKDIGLISIYAKNVMTLTAFLAIKIIIFVQNVSVDILLSIEIANLVHIIALNVMNKGKETVIKEAAIMAMQGSIIVAV